MAFTENLNLIKCSSEYCKLGLQVKLIQKVYGLRRATEAYHRVFWVSDVIYWHVPSAYIRPINYRAHQLTRSGLPLPFLYILSSAHSLSYNDVTILDLLRFEPGRSAAFDEKKIEFTSWSKRQISHWQFT